MARAPWLKRQAPEIALAAAAPPRVGGLIEREQLDDFVRIRRTVLVVLRRFGRSATRASRKRLRARART